MNFMFIIQSIYLHIKIKNEVVFGACFFTGCGNQTLLVLLTNRMC